MPELPDVQVFKDYLDATALHARIRAAHLASGRLLRKTSGRVLAARLRGRSLVGTRRFVVPHRRAGEPCPRCGAELRANRIGGRTSYCCPRHQRRRR
ncbi:MAG: hypothetical protein KJ025_04155 [Burkholderiales bacterium]|nr:hypothetical protein [Burkholderiales bacterium]